MNQGPGGEQWGISPSPSLPDLDLVTPEPGRYVRPARGGAFRDHYPLSISSWTSPSRSTPGAVVRAFGSASPGWGISEALSLIDHGTVDRRLRVAAVADSVHHQ